MNSAPKRLTLAIIGLAKAELVAVASNRPAAIAKVFFITKVLPFSLRTKERIERALN